MGDPKLEVSRSFNDGMDRMIQEEEEEKQKKKREEEKQQQKKKGE